MQSNPRVLLTDLFVKLYGDGTSLTQSLGVAFPRLVERGELPFAHRKVREVAFDCVEVLMHRNAVNSHLFAHLLVDRDGFAEEILRVADALGIVLPHTTTFTLLHLTDRHTGQHDPEHHWPGTREGFYEDLRKVLHMLQQGPDVVVFTGDLTMKGLREEYDKLDDDLGELWEVIRSETGAVPAFVPVPGNHDLSWRDPASPAIRRLLDLEAHPDARTALLTDPTSAERIEVEAAFAEYTAWTARCPLPRLSGRTAGLLPGDESGWFEKGDFRLGFVGLNTAALQLCDAKHVPNPLDPREPFKGRMLLDKRQFQEACGGDGPRWVRKQTDLSLLLTHHGSDWLLREDQASLDAFIYPPGRFLAHLYGHIHVSALRSLAVAGASHRRWLQGRSLFGMEWSGGREHGYTVCCIEAAAKDGTLRFWPRKATPKAHGAWTFSFDDMDLEMDGGTSPVKFSIARERPRGKAT